MAHNESAGIVETQPKTFDERLAVAGRCNSALEISSPLLIDTIDDKVCKDYSAFPDRLYLIDRDGKVVYKSGRGPFGYKPREMEQVLNMMLLDLKPEEADAEQ